MWLHRCFSLVLLAFHNTFVLRVRCSSVNKRGLSAGEVIILFCDIITNKTVQFYRGCQRVVLGNHLDINDIFFVHRNLKLLLMWSHPWHRHCVHIQRENETLVDFKRDIRHPVASLNKKITLFALSDTGVSLCLNLYHISQAWSLWGRNHRQEIINIYIKS